MACIPHSITKSWKHIAIGSVLFKIIVLLFIVLLLEGCGITPTACVGGDCITLEVADTPEKRQTGLMEHNSLGQGQGMLFVFDTPGVYPFWMKNMDFAIDMLWMNREFEVIYIEKNVSPCKTEQCKSYGPMKPSWYVLETSKGWSDGKLEIGSTIDIHGLN